MKYKKLVWTISLPFLSVFGCSSDGSSMLNDSSPLLDTVWTLESYQPLGGVRTNSEMIHLSTIRINSANNTVIGGFNCVGLVGTYSIVGNLIDISIPTRDEGECGVDMNSPLVEEVIVLNRAFLSGEPLRFEITDNGLTFITSINEMLFYIDRGDEIAEIGEIGE